MKRAANDTEARLIHIKQLLKLLTGQTAELHRLAALKTLDESADKPRRSARRVRRRKKR